MRVSVLIDETSEGDYIVGVYSSPQKAAAARAAEPRSFEMSIWEYEIDDPTTRNYERIYDPR